MNFNIFGGFQKTEYFWGYDDFVDIFGVITKLDYRMHFRSFLKVKVQNGGYFLGCLNFKYLFGVLEILDIFWG